MCCVTRRHVLLGLCLCMADPRLGVAGRVSGGRGGRSVTRPSVWPQEWLEAELECLGIDSAAYARTVLSLLTRDSIDPAEVIQSGYVLVANKVPEPATRRSA